MRTKQPRIDSVIGIDPSMNSSGICINKTSGISHNRTITRKDIVGHYPKAKKSHSHYCHYQSKFMMNYIAACIQGEFKKSLVVMENYAFGAMGRTFQLAETSGLIKHRLLFQRHLPYNNLWLCTTQHLKMFCVGKGTCKKDLVIKEVFKQWGFDTVVSDEADAYVLMKIGEHLAWKRDISKYKQGIIKRIKDHNKRK